MYLRLSVIVQVSCSHSSQVGREEEVRNSESGELFTNIFGYEIFLSEE